METKYKFFSTVKRWTSKGVRHSIVCQLALFTVACGYSSFSVSETTKSDGYFLWGNKADVIAIRNQKGEWVLPRETKLEIGLAKFTEGPRIVVSALGNYGNKNGKSMVPAECSMTAFTKKWGEYERVSRAPQSGSGIAVGKINHDTQIAILDREGSCEVRLEMSGPSGINFRRIAFKSSICDQYGCEAIAEAYAKFGRVTFITPTGKIAIEFVVPQLEP